MCPIGSGLPGRPGGSAYAVEASGAIPGLAVLGPLRHRLDGRRSGRGRGLGAPLGPRLDHGRLRQEPGAFRSLTWAFLPGPGLAGHAALLPNVEAALAVVLLDRFLEPGRAPPAHELRLRQGVPHAARGAEPLDLLQQRLGDLRHHPLDGHRRVAVRQHLDPAPHPLHHVRYVLLPRLCVRPEESA